MRSRRQITGVNELAGRPPRCVLDLGCGAGRVLVPLARAGHRVIGIDRDAVAIDRCRKRLEDDEVDVVLKRSDYLASRWPRWPDRGRAPLYDLVLLLGNTLMTVVDLDDAARLFRRVRRGLAADGQFVVDDMPHDLWPELTSGRWQTGVREDGAMQIVWHPSEPVFALRSGSAVRPGTPRLRADEPCFRLWTTSDLRLLAGWTGLSEPEHDAGHGLLVMKRR